MKDAGPASPLTKYGCSCTEDIHHPLDSLHGNSGDICLFLAKLSGWLAFYAVHDRIQVLGIALPNVKS